MPQHKTFIFTDDKAQTNLTHKLALARLSNRSTRDLQLDWTQVQTDVYKPTKLPQNIFKCYFIFKLNYFIILFKIVVIFHKITVILIK